MVVFQQSAIPQPIQLAEFANADGPGIVGGLDGPLSRFSRFVDRMPSFERLYQPSGESVSNYYRSILQLARADLRTNEGTELLAAAIADVELQLRADTSGIGLKYLPAYASPYDWPSDTNMLDMVLATDGTLKVSGHTIPALQTEEKTDTGFLVDGASMGVLDPISRGAILIRGSVVQIDRPWLHWPFLESDRWGVPGRAKGFVSSGSSVSNDGDMPLIPITMVVAFEIHLQASIFDQLPHVRSAVDKGGSVSLVGMIVAGPEVIATKVEDATLLVRGAQIVGWISRLVNKTPGYDGTVGDPGRRNQCQQDAQLAQNYLFNGMRDQARNHALNVVMNCGWSSDTDRANEVLRKLDNTEDT